MARVLQWARWLLCENSSNGEGGHRGDWGWWPKFRRWQRGRLGEKSGATEKHRTEVTEATEGDLGLVAKFYWCQLRRLGEKSGATESIAQRGRRPQRGIWGVAKIPSVAAWAFGREIKVQGESIAQRSQRPQRGIGDGWPKFYRWQRERLGEKSGATEKHRTEVTEVTEGELGWVAKILSVAAWAFGREIKSKGKASHRGRGGRVGFMFKDSISCSGVRSTKCKPLCDLCAMLSPGS